jgi:hypothetical protein
VDAEEHALPPHVDQPVLRLYRRKSGGLGAT